jgi:hypothetical protein
MARVPFPSEQPGSDDANTARKIARPDEERGYPRRDACPDCGLKTGHAIKCPNRS